MDLNTIIDYCVKILIALLGCGFVIKIIINIRNNKYINNNVDDHSEHNNAKYIIKDDHSVKNNYIINYTNTNSDKHEINNSTNKSVTQAEHVSLKDYLQSKLNDNKEPKRKILDNQLIIENEFEKVFGEKFDELEKELGKNEKRILLLLNKEPRLSTQNIAMRTGLSMKSVRNLLKALKDLGIIKWQGSYTHGMWIINKAD